MNFTILLRRRIKLRIFFQTKDHLTGKGEIENCKFFSEVQICFLPLINYPYFYFRFAEKKLF